MKYTIVTALYITRAKVARLLEEPEEEDSQDGVLDSDVRVDVGDVRHEVGQRAVVRALVRAPREREHRLLQL